MDMCKSILADVIALPEAGMMHLGCLSHLEAFLQPVPWKEWGLDDYPRIIKQPMDLGTVNVGRRLDVSYLDRRVLLTASTRIYMNLRMICV